MHSFCNSFNHPSSLHCWFLLSPQAWLAEDTHCTCGELEIVFRHVSTTHFHIWTASSGVYADVFENGQVYFLCLSIHVLEFYPGIITSPMGRCVLAGSLASTRVFEPQLLKHSQLQGASTGPPRTSPPACMPSRIRSCHRSTGHPRPHPSCLRNLRTA